MAASPLSPNCPPACAGRRLRQTGAFTPVTAEELEFIEGFRRGVSAVPADASILYEQKPSGKFFARYSGWAFRDKTLRPRN